MEFWQASEDAELNEEEVGEGEDEAAGDRDWLSSFT